MSSRNSLIDVEKFIASLVIMSLHSYVLYHGEGILPFNDAWIFVEFFLIITGFYTAKHFDGIVTENKAKECFVYTLKKFIPLFPYTILAVVSQWLTFGIMEIVKGVWGIKDLISVFLNVVPFEMLLLQTVPVGESPFVATFWYLISLIIVFPIFIGLTCLSNRYLKLLIGIVYTITYYSIVGVASYCALPISLFRVLASLAIGMAIYEIIEIFGDSIKLKSKFIYVLAALIFIAVIIATFRNLALHRFYLMCIVINLLIMMPGRITSLRAKEVWAYLGRLSMPIYILHYAVGTIVDLVIVNDNLMVKTIIYYSVSIVAAIIAMTVFDRVKFTKKCLQALENLKD